MIKTTKGQISFDFIIVITIFILLISYIVIIHNNTYETTNKITNNSKIYFTYLDNINYFFAKTYGFEVNKKIKTDANCIITSNYFGNKDFNYKIPITINNTYSCNGFIIK